jgi:hypothetical protein
MRKEEEAQSTCDSAQEPYPIHASEGFLNSDVSNTAATPRQMMAPKNSVFRYFLDTNGVLSLAPLAHPLAIAQFLAAVILSEAKDLN